MSLTKTVTIDKLEIVGDYKAIQARTATIVAENGVELSRGFHREVFMPDADLTNAPQEVKDIAAVVHTQEVKDAYAAKKAEENI